MNQLLSAQYARQLPAADSSPWRRQVRPLKRGYCQLCNAASTKVVVRNVACRDPKSSP